MASKVFQVSEVNLYIKNLFRDDFLLNHLQIEGEVSNAKVHSSGHIYFTLKDDTGAISCVLFAGYVKKDGIIPENGKKIIVSGGIGLYEKTGSYQVYVRDIKASGQGDLFQKLEELKKKMMAEGIFEKPKKEIPTTPEKIGIVTSATGAAIQDILQIAKRRNPNIQLILYPTLVQGERAADNIAAGIAYFNRQKDKVDTLIVGRGGGAIEDLWPFNEEIVVRAIFHSKIPVISAVGHETDVTLSDFVADLRASTPSAGAELAIPMQMEQKQRIINLQVALHKEFQLFCGRWQKEMEVRRLQLGRYHPRKRLEEIALSVMQKEKELGRELAHTLKKWSWQISLKQKELAALNPQKKLGMGYAFLTNQKGLAIVGVEEVEAGETIKAYLPDGKLQLKVERIEYGGEEK